MAAGLPEALIRQLNSRATLAENLILQLRRQVDQLSASMGCSQGDIQNQIKDVRSENEQLKAEISIWKDKLIMAEKAKGIRQVSTCLPAAKAAAVKPPAAAEPVSLDPSEDGNSKKAQKKANKSSGNKSEEANKDNEASAEVADVGRLDMRVGIIRSAKRHPDADALYVEEVDLGEGKPRTVISGLVKFIPEDQMQNRKAILLCNLKPAKMRGILSEAMVMCASTPDKVEILSPPESSNPGDPVMVEGYERRPDAQLNPKKKIFETCAPDLRVNSLRVATYRGTPWTVNGEHCTAQTLVDVQIK